MSFDKIWKLKAPSTDTHQLAHEAGLTSLQAQLLINRGISDKESARFFLRPQLTDMADPMLMKDMGEAIEVIIDALEKREKITIYGDYDADGLTATALLLNFLSCLDGSVSFYIPNRLKEGYGLNMGAVEKIARSGTRLIITADCGSANAKEIEFAKGLGMRVVVTDHHQIPGGFQPNCPVINPHRTDCPFPYKDLAGVGLVFFLAVAIRAGLREKRWFEERAEPDLRDYLDLVALGTVADRVPLFGQNRMLAKNGIMRMAKSRWVGIKAMVEAAGLSGSQITADDLAFRLAPRLNAPGRMGDPEIALQILSTNQSALAKNIALELEAANSRRQNLERDILDQIEHVIHTTDRIGGLRTLVLAGENWHKGVLGIVASRLVDKYHRPSLVLSIQDGMAVGSGRSIGAFNLYGALSQLGHLFEKFGGHAHAAGFTLKAEKLDILRSELEDLAIDALDERDLIPTIEVDTEISLKDITFETVQKIRDLAPFGEGNPEPLFCGRSLEVLGSWIVGERHLKLRVRQDGRGFEAIGFEMSDEYPLDGKTINMVFTPDLNRWQGYESIQLRIIDLEETDQATKIPFPPAR